MEKPSVGQQLIDLLKQSVLVQALITLAVTTTVLVMAAQLLPVPDWMLQILWLVLGFYFGSKVGWVQGYNTPTVYPPGTVIVPPPEAHNDN